MQITLNDRVIAEDLVVAPGQRVDLREMVEVTAGQLILTFSCPPEYNWFISALTIHPVVPQLTHTPITSWERGKPLVIQATATDQPHWPGDSELPNRERAGIPYGYDEALA